MTTSAKTLDVITIGRSSVDLYGAQVGGRLEDMGSFQKYIGGSPTNMAAGTARLGLKSALITRVGDEHMGRFIREELAREGVDSVSHAHHAIVLRGQATLLQESRQTCRSEACPRRGPQRFGAVLPCCTTHSTTCLAR